jgi:hypothetical protein
MQGTPTSRKIGSNALHRRRHGRQYGHVVDRLGQPFFLRRSASGKYDDGACNDIVCRATIKMRTIYGRPWFPAPPDPPIEPGGIRHRALEAVEARAFEPHTVRMARRQPIPSANTLYTQRAYGLPTAIGTAAVQ